MVTWEGYLTIQRVSDGQGGFNLNEANWVKLILSLDELTGVGSNANQIMRDRMMVAPNGFWHDTGEVDSEDEPILEWYGNAIIYAANFRKTMVNFDKFLNRLENLFEVAPGSVTYTTQLVTLKDHPSIVATYKYGANNRIRVALMGCDSDDHDNYCNVKRSNVELLQLLANDPVEWGETTE